MKKGNERYSNLRRLQIPLITFIYFAATNLLSEIIIDGKLELTKERPLENPAEVDIQPLYFFL